ncbi:hypothetical protein [Sporosarcina sp. FSL K6-1508]|uniref:hypothetical protein n=1 Tax=Sporosarcina sp. FSL K6-1508 TaxID=2921553 RepID=UPI0030F7C814
MYTDFLWLLGAKQQYDRQKELGLAGLSGLLLVIFMVWKWDSIFYPLASKFGFVSLAERFGLINDDLAIMTLINVSAVLFFLALFIALGSFILVVVGCSLMVVGGSQLGKRLLGFAAFILFFPLILIFMIVTQYRRSTTLEDKGSLRNTYRDDSTLKPLLKKFKHHAKPLEYFHLYEEQINRENDESNVDFASAEVILAKLNRAVASIKDDRDWLFGYDETEEQWYVLFPNPLPTFASPCAEYNQMNPYDAILEYQKYNVRGFTENENDRDGFHVPAMPIDFLWEWTEARIKPSIQFEKVPMWVGSSDMVERAQMVIKNTKLLKTFNINSPDVPVLFNSIAEHEILEKWNRNAHVVLYLIPIVFLPFLPNPVSSERLYNNAISNIRHVDVFSPIYAADVENHLAYFKNIGKNWSNTWFKNVK